MSGTRDGGFGSGTGLPHETSTGEQDARTGQAAQAREVQRLRQQGRGLRTQAVYQDGVPVGTETVVVDAVQGPTSGVRGASGQREAAAQAELGAYAPRTLTRAEMVALIGEDGMARAEAAEGVRVEDAATGAPAVGELHVAAPPTTRVVRSRKAPRVTAPAQQEPTPIPASEPAPGAATAATLGARWAQQEAADPTFADDVAAGVEIGLTAAQARAEVRASRGWGYVLADAAAPQVGYVDARTDEERLRDATLTVDVTITPPAATRVPAYAAAAVPEQQTEEALVFGVDVQEAEDTPSVALTFHGAEIVPEPDVPDTRRMPAASDTDTPSRGIPKPIDDPGKKITGGFGEPTGTNLGEAGYFPFDGLELGKSVIPSLCERLIKRVADDLRFSRAIVYPRVSVRLELVVEAYGQDEAMTVPVVWAPAAGQPGTTAAALAAQHADELVFVIRETLQEFDAAGNPETPPNAAREDLGLAVPRKQRVKAGRGWQVVDRV